MLKMKKGINPLISAIFILIISIGGISLVLEIGMPALERSRESSVFDEAQSNLNLIENTIDEVRFGGNGTSRTVTVDVTEGEYHFNASQDRIGFEYTMESNFLPGELCYRDGSSLTRTFGGERILDLRFKEGEGNETVDCSQYENHAVLNGSNWTKTTYGSALEFDGVDDEVVVPDDQSLDQTDFTISAFVKWSGTVDDVNDNISLILGSDSNYMIGVTEKNGSIHLTGKFTDNSATEVNITSNSSIDANKWHLATFSYDSTDGELRMYVDGELDQIRSYGSSPQPDNYDKVIGYIHDGLKQDYGSWRGKIESIRIYSRSLKREEVKRISDGGSVATPNRLSIDLSTPVNLTRSLRLQKGRHNLLFRNLGYRNRTKIEVSSI